MGDTDLLPEPLQLVITHKGIQRLTPCARCGVTGYIDPRREGGVLLAGETHYCDCAHGEKARARDARDAEEYARDRALVFGGQWDKGLAVEDDERAYSLATYRSLRSPKSLSMAMQFISTWDFKQNLIMWGPTGVGKTGLAISMARHVRDAMIARQMLVKFVVVPTLFDELKAGFADGDYEALWAHLCSVHLLILDDVGTESPTSWARERLYLALNTRVKRRLPTWITTNLDLRLKQGRDGTASATGELVSWMQERVVSRLLQHGAVMNVTGHDLRLAQ